LHKSLSDFVVNDEFDLVAFEQFQKEGVFKKTGKKAFWHGKVLGRVLSPPKRSDRQ